MKRGDSGLSMVLGVIKTSGMTSHDVVSKVRRGLGEKRVGHAGTLDPFASGVLPVLVGPATRLDKYITEHDKAYIADITLGVSTETDDRCGEVLRTSPVPPHAADPDFAARTLDAFVGKSMQMPPAYSAIKVGGKKSCDEARKGNLIKLEPREVEVYSARLIGVEDAGDVVVWKAAFHVSKGTYIRALARDIGRRIGIPAHLSELVRRTVGCIGIEDCLPLDDMESLRTKAQIDPVRLLNLRVLFADERQSSFVRNGRPVDPSEARLFVHCGSQSSNGCSCMPAFAQSTEPLSDGELVAVVSHNKLAAVYRFDSEKGMLVADCVFQVEVSRGADI